MKWTDFHLLIVVCKLEVKLLSACIHTLSQFTRNVHQFLADTILYIYIYICTIVFYKILFALLLVFIFKQSLPLQIHFCRSVEVYFTVPSLVRFHEVGVCFVPECIECSDIKLISLIQGKN
jgi:hypothetical protein